MSVVAGVSVLSALHIIPLKMRAHIDNKRLRDEGAPVSEKVLRKRRNHANQLLKTYPQAVLFCGVHIDCLCGINAIIPYGTLLKPLAKAHLSFIDAGILFH